MSEILKLSFETEEGKRILSIANPKEGITQDEAKEAMESIVASEAFPDLIAVDKAVLYTSDSEVIYEA